MVSYQCSQLSTSETIVEVFSSAMTLQRKQNRSNFVAVVVLDEVGLAEDSPYLPLKALHPLLEDGTEGADSYEQVHKMCDELYSRFYSREKPSTSLGNLNTEFRPLNCP